MIQNRDVNFSQVSSVEGKFYLVFSFDWLVAQ